MSDQLSADLHSLRITRGEPPPPRRLTGVVVALLAVAVSGFAIRKYAIPYATNGLFKQDVSLTEISMVSPGQAEVDLTSTGYVVAQTIVKVGAKVVGRVSKTNVKEWGPVKANQVLFVLDPADQKAAVATGRARAMAARARAQTARANVAEVRIQLEREKRLLAQGAVSSSGVEDLAARVNALQQQVNAADAEAAAVEAEVGSLKTNLDDLTVRAPIDGVASTKPAEVGDVVRPDQTLVEISDLRTLIVEADVAEARLSLVKEGGPCEIVLDAFSAKRFRGEVLEVSPVLDRAKAAAKVKVKFVDAAEGARSQMAVRVSFLAKEQSAEELKAPAKKIIPGSAIVDKDGAKVAYVVSEGRVHITKLNLGPAMGAGFELNGGPGAGTKLVNNPIATLTDGQAVQEGSNK